ncbi:hypothetical protein LRS05_15600 [Flavobacterium sp. J372]|uniref:hypothetical protein n=1 Tax=Flavobacterium sp. J372 TaxID=2898436 RepID=UPI002151113D|nr:hypothetical protein [Flavobacterium sp. J372]MCR5860686.1 hypothetical protein [Flavobacterium sp. J372]MCR5860705.1 hypothetical protein [Flavobacterium sp. J372]MCR5863453.1 hypothetical protein [Flavobacterium sp. J372]
MSKDKKDIYTGIIGKDEKGNYHCGEYLLDYKIVVNSFKEGDKITIRSVIENPSDISYHDYPMKSKDFVLADKKFVKTPRKEE